MDQESLILSTCRGLCDSDNERNPDHWVLERGKHGFSGMYISALKTGTTHFISCQNGDINSGISPRNRVGLWHFDTQHISYLGVKFNDESAENTFKKYVRGLGYTYRSFKGYERLDYIPPEKGLLVFDLFAKDRGTFDIQVKASHEKSWPQVLVAKSYETSVSNREIKVNSEIASTVIHVDCDGDISIRVNGPYVDIRSENTKNMRISFSCDGSSPDNTDIKNSIEYHNSVKRFCEVETPDERFNKLFLWAKHDILELYTKTPIGNGFYAGIPKFSWFFGRDGEWISNAAIECGMDELAKDQLDLLYRFSKNGRIPHEIPLSNDGVIKSLNFKVGGSPINTQFMSIDSSPLWIILQFQLSTWTGIKPEMEKITKVYNFCKSCDRDNDGLIENRFTEGLIGWPESWAKNRDGICIEVNAWWLEAWRLYTSAIGKGKSEYDEALKTFTNMFYTHNGEIVTPPDSIDGDIRRMVKGAMQIVPGMYLNDSVIRKSLEWLSRDDMATAWGVRSLSIEDPAYDGNYHTGTIWPLMSGWMAISLYNNRMPERGFNMLMTFIRQAFYSLDPGRINETYHPEFMYPTGQFFQGWSSSIFIQAFLEGLLGIPRIPQGDNILTEINQNLPSTWNVVRIRRFKFRGKTLDLEITKSQVREIHD